MIFAYYQSDMSLPTQTPPQASNRGLYQATLPTDQKPTELAFGDRLVGAIARRILFPKKNTKTLEAARERLYTHFPTAKRVHFLSPEGYKLDAIHVSPVSSSEQETPKAILFCPGADGYYEDNWSYNFIQWVQNQVGNVHILIANYAGTQESEGKFHPKTLATSVYSSFCYLAESYQIDPRYIALFSQSLGGLATNLALPSIRERYPEARFCLVNERSMSRFIPIIERMMGTGFLMRLPLSLLRRYGWNVENLEQTFLDCPGEKLIVHCPNDPVIPLEASMLDALQRVSSENNVLMLREAQENENGHMRPFDDREARDLAIHVRRMLDLEPQVAAGVAQE